MSYSSFGDRSSIEGDRFFVGILQPTGYSGQKSASLHNSQKAIALKGGRALFLGIGLGRAIAPMHMCDS